MKTTSINTIAGLSTYFLDSVMDAHRGSYPAAMTLAEFDLQLETYRVGMNDHNSCSFPTPSRRSINAIYKVYVAAKAARA